MDTRVIGFIKANWRIIAIGLIIGIIALYIIRILVLPSEITVSSGEIVYDLTNATQHNNI